jgi:hypothetical protein
VENLNIDPILDDPNGSRPDLKCPEFREAARLLGSIRTQKKSKAVKQNLEKARAILSDIRAARKANNVVNPPV